jgi:5-formyltetrahydrofolate cyclo-ligase
MEIKGGIGEEKKALRAAVRARVKALSPAQRAPAAIQACALLAGQTVWRDSRNVLLFAPLPDELDVWPLVEMAFEMGKTVSLPRFDAKSGSYLACTVGDPSRALVPGRFGIREPAGACVAIATGVDLILVPGLAFDLSGHRIGRGGGYYDRLLERVPGERCGVAFDEQIVRAIPREPHDLRMDYVLTPTRWIAV